MHETVLWGGFLPPAATGHRVTNTKIMAKYEPELSAVAATKPARKPAWSVLPSLQHKETTEAHAGQINQRHVGCPGLLQSRAQDETLSP